MKGTWALQDAKNRFSEVVNCAVSDGPQTITRRGRETAIVVAVDDFRSLFGGKGDLVEFLRRSPLAGVELDLSRDEDYGREVEL